RRREVGSSHAGDRGDDAFQKFRREAERETAVAGAVLMAAFERVRIVAEQQRPRRQHRRAQRGAVLESPLRHCREAHALMPFGERAIVRAGSGDHVLDATAGARCQNIRGQRHRQRLAIFPKPWRAVERYQTTPVCMIHNSSMRRDAMIDHVSIGVRDVAKTKRFYDAALKPLGYQCLSEGKDSLGYGRGAVALWISTAEHPVPPDMKSGLHFSFTAPTPN